MLSGQGKLELEDIRHYEVPSVSTNFKDSIFKILNKRISKINDADKAYVSAQNILLQELGLDNFQPSTEKTNIKSLKDSFFNTERLDAEYYQVKYEQVVEKIKSATHDRLKKLVHINKSIEPGSKSYDEDGKLPFMRVADYSKFGTTEPQKNLSDLFVKENRELINELKPKKGTILFSKDGSVGTAYHLRRDFEGITSGAILHLTVKDTQKVIPEYLTLALNSKVVQMQAERDAGGSIILHWRVKQIEDVIVPIIDYTIQQEIADLIEESFVLKKRSEYLLEVAKQAVEVAIEQDENAAIDFINKSKTGS